MPKQFQQKYSPKKGNKKTETKKRLTFLTLTLNTKTNWQLKYK